MVLMAIGMVVGGAVWGSNLTYRITKRYTNPEKAEIVGGAVGTAAGWLGGKAIDHASKWAGERVGAWAAARIGAEVGGRVGTIFGGLVGLAVGLAVGAAIGY
ncbi:hypothetical protein [Thermococcus sp. 21S7]|uniref:hypothetical protein n=1 Tax=Thermococcus sp. 21S7 TaxID=1638221 RepID=UPI0014392B0D|nr:hypothetical protein [Thermococcus sp. 21S7]NJE61366.1 hypothetical protein [Thermococcus sp. 21S7]